MQKLLFFLSKMQIILWCHGSLLKLCTKNFVLILSTIFIFRFKADGKNCGPGPRQLKVRLNSQIYLVCPNLATVLHPRGTDVQTSDMWENIWLLKNKTAFDECDVSQLPVAQRRKDLHLCNNPTGLVFLSLLFLEHAAGRDDRTFDEGRTYYVMGKEK